MLPTTWRGCLRGIATGFLLILAARSAEAIPQLLVDMQNGQVLYEEEAGQPWHPASLTKLMTAYLAFDAIAAGRLTLDSPVIISKRALSMPPAKLGLPVGTAIRLEDALYIMLVKSANDVAIAVAETVAGTEENFVAEMNSAALTLDMSATHFTNANGLHDPAQVTSARDLAVLALAIRSRFPQFDPMFSTGIVRLGKSRLPSQNNLLAHFAGTTGMKTGYICASGLNIVATVERSGRRLLAVVLGGSSSRERGEMTAQLVLKAISGDLPPTGKQLADIADHPLAAPPDMKALLCGKQAKAYVAGRAKQFPLGLKGEPSNLVDNVAPRLYRASTLGKIRNVPLPRPRPAFAPLPEIATGFQLPLPRSRPADAGFSLVTADPL